MIVPLLRLTRWEWFKLRKRWMPWILLGIVVVITQFFLWGGYAAYHNEAIRSFVRSGNLYSASTQTDDGIVSIELTCADVAEGRLAEKLEALPEDFRERQLDNIQDFSEGCAGLTALDQFREGFTLPSGMTGGIGVAHSILGILILILAASVMGAEYSWGTLRNVLTKGVRRWQLPASKLLLLLLLGAAGLIVMSVLIAVSSLIAAIIPPQETGGPFGAGEWSEAAVMFGKAVYAMAPYIMLATFLAVLTSSSSMGISLSLGYYFVELFVAPIFQLTSWLQNAPDYLIVQNVNIWMGEAAVVGAEVTRDGVSLETPGTLHAFVVMLVYIVVLGVAAFRLFMRKDIAGATGE